MIKTCKIHGETKHYARKPSGWRCSHCSKDAVNKRRRKVKEQLIREFGGKCCSCDYSRYVGALEFHHLDPSLKTFSVSGRSISIRRLRAEANKCIILCSNCHKELEAGIIEWKGLTPIPICVDCGSPIGFLTDGKIQGSACVTNPACPSQYQIIEG